MPQKISRFWDPHARRLSKSVICLVRVHIEYFNGFNCNGCRNENGAWTVTLCFGFHGNVGDGGIDGRKNPLPRQAIIRLTMLCMFGSILI